MWLFLESLSLHWSSIPRLFVALISELPVTLWLCQNSYWTWPFMVSFPIKKWWFSIVMLWYMMIYWYQDHPSSPSKKIKNLAKKTMVKPSFCPWLCSIPPLPPFGPSGLRPLSGRWWRWSPPSAACAARASRPRRPGTRPHPPGRRCSASRWSLESFRALLGPCWEVGESPRFWDLPSGYV